MTQTLMQTLAWSLLHFLWQGAAIAALAAALMLLLRKPATRYLLGVGALGLMLLSFAVTFSLLGSADASQGAVGGGSALAESLQFQTGVAPSDLRGFETAAAASNSHLDFTWVARGWLVGVFLLALRIAFGLFVIEQLRRRNLVALPDTLVQRLRSLQARLGIRRGIRYAECALVNVPAVIGFFRPVVLIPMRALTGLSAEQLDALIAHELGHIKRFDVAVNFAQVIAETLFFFHPAVWWLNKRIRADREECCDDIAVAATGSSVGYAKSLATIVHWDAQRSDVPSFAMAAAGAPVAARVARLLGVHREGSSRTSGVLAAALVLAGALVTGALSLGFADLAQAQDARSETPLVSPVNPSSPALPPEPPSPVTAAPVVKALPAAKSAREPRLAPRPATAAANEVETQVRGDVSYIDEMRGAKLGDLDADDLVALKVQGVTSQYISDIRATGLAPSVDQIVAMKVHGVVPAYVRQVRAMGFDVGADEIIGFKVHDVSPEYATLLRELGLKFDADELLAMRVHGITPDFVQQMRAKGFDADTDQLIALKVHDVTAEYRQRLLSAGLNLNVDQLVHAKVMDITPEFIDQVAAHGFKNLNIDQLIALKNADVL